MWIRTNKRTRTTPLGAVAKGMVAGAIGTTVMDALWYLRYSRDGGTSGPLHWEFGGVDSWDDASAPGKVGKRLAEGFLQRPLSDKAAATTNNLVHWIYGLTWGAVYGIFAGSLHRPGVALGPVFGTAVWLSDYVLLPLSGLYKPIWQYDLKTLWKDWSAHLVYGTSTAAAFGLIDSDRLITGRRRVAA